MNDFQPIGIIEFVEQVLGIKPTPRQKVLLEQYAQQMRDRSQQMLNLHGQQVALHMPRPREIPRMPERTCAQFVEDLRSLGTSMGDVLANTMEAAIPADHVVKVDSMSFGVGNGRTVAAESWTGTSESVVSLTDVDPSGNVCTTYGAPAAPEWLCHGCNQRYYVPDEDARRCPWCGDTKGEAIR